MRPNIPVCGLHGLELTVEIRGANMFRQRKNPKQQKADQPVPGSQTDVLSEKLKGLQPPAAWNAEALAEAERAAAKSNAAKGDDTDRLLKVTGMS
jgi:hypothetical protein